MRPIGNLSVLSPALILTWDQIERIVEILDASLRATVAGLTRDGVGFAG